MSSSSSPSSSSAAAPAAASAASSSAGAAPWLRAPSANASAIKNKLKRSEVFQKQRLQKLKAKGARRKRQREEEEADEDGGAARKAARPAPRTIESMRLPDDTLVLPGDAEVLRDEADDEFADVWSGRVAPKVMLTTARYPSARIFPLLAELLRCVPRAFYYKRGHFELKSICGFAADKGFTHLLVLTERLKTPNGLLVIKLPLGPTAAFKLRSVVRAGDISGHGASTAHVPELILNNFGTRLGRRIGRVLGSLFPHTPDFSGRQVVTFHNQRDFVFFRHHRYIFEDAEGGTGTAADEEEGGGGAAGGARSAADEAAAVARAAAEGGPESRASRKKREKREAKAAALRALRARRVARTGGSVSVRTQELGPRFTLKLKYLLAGTFDTAFGEYEYLHRRHESEALKRKFAL